jgi:hypothetical protein
MSRRSGTGANGDDPGAPRDEGLSIFGPLELPRDETEYLPAYDEHDQYGDAGGTRVATPSMIVPPHPGPPPAGPPAYPGGPPPGYPAGPPPGAAPFQAAAPPRAPGAEPATPGTFPEDLFRPGPSAGPAAPPGPHAYAPPPPPMSGQPQYAAPAMPPRRTDHAGGAGDGFGGSGVRGGSGDSGGGFGNVPRGAIVAGAVGVVAVVLVVVLLVGGVFDSKSGGTGNAGVSGTPAATPTASAPATSAAPSKTPKTQIQQMDQLLDTSAGSRTAVQQAVNEIERCGDIATAVQTLNDAAAQRDEQVRALGQMKTDEIPRGDELAQWLRKAWEASARADRAFAAWGRENAADECADGGKRAKSTDDKRAATRESGTATAAKNKAVAIWNDAARQAGLKSRVAGEI